MRYVAAKSAEEASNFLLQETGVSRVLAGGTDVLVQMKSGMIEPDLIVDIKKIPGIRNIKIGSNFKYAPKIVPLLPILILFAASVL